MINVMRTPLSHLSQFFCTCAREFTNQYHTFPPKGLTKLMNVHTKTIV